jgi:hypothetical protein
MTLRCERKEVMSLIKLVENSNLDNLHIKPECHVVSKAFSMSKDTAAVDILLLKFRVTWSVSLIHCSVVLCRARKPNWLSLNRLAPTVLIIFRQGSHIKHPVFNSNSIVACVFVAVGTCLPRRCPETVVVYRVAA